MKPTNSPTPLRSSATTSPRPAVKGPKFIKAAAAKTVTKAKPALVEPLALTEILVPVDFSEHSRAALDYARSLAVKFSARIAVVHIIEQVVYPGDWVFAPVSMPAFVGERTDDLVERLRQFAGEGGIEVVPIVRLGRPWQQIVEVAAERKCDLIVTATHGHTGLKHVLLGSVAEKIVRHAPCPVLSVRAE